MSWTFTTKNQYGNVPTDKNDTQKKPYKNAPDFQEHLRILSEMLRTCNLSEDLNYCQTMQKTAEQSVGILRSSKVFEDIRKMTKYARTTRIFQNPLAYRYPVNFLVVPQTF